MPFVLLYRFKFKYQYIRLHNQTWVIGSCHGFSFIMPLQGLRFWVSTCLLPVLTLIVCNFYFYFLYFKGSLFSSLFLSAWNLSLCFISMCSPSPVPVCFFSLIFLLSFHVSPFFEFAFFSRDSVFFIYWILFIYLFCLCPVGILWDFFVVIS